MRHGFTFVAHKLIGAAILTIIYIQTICPNTVLAEDVQTYSKSEDDNLQTAAASDLTKRKWDQNLKMWGKRAWSNLHGGWGIKRSVPDDDTLNIDPSIDGYKRSWQNFRDGWGKRNLTPREMLENEIEYLGDDGFPNDYNDEEKRSWNQLHSGWGKRNKWSEFRGAWGKRGPDPAWNNLRGIWGKRNYYTD